jgi:Protein of unknown function (DUF3048) N-terminal domain/Protein of unknown function (DUF3048) C-terminal domain
VLAQILDSPRKRVIVAIIGFALLVGAVAMFALGGDDEEAEPTTTTTSTTVASTTSTAPQPVAPLTGVAGSFEGRLDRPALVVKVDNGEPKARPQAGINQADVVYEERVEGAVTRFLTIFHSTDAAPIGPVRSARTSDIPIFTPLHRPLFAWSGANGTFAGRIRSAPIADVGYDARSGDYYRESGRTAPSNLMLRSSVTMLGLPAPGSSPPTPLFNYVREGTKTANLEGVAGVHITFGGSGGAAPVDYRWNGKGWARDQRGTPHVDAQGVQIAPENVIVQFVSYAPTDVNDQFGNPIPEAQTIGSGEAWVFTQGGVVKGTWQKTDAAAVTTYTDAQGNPILLAPGRTWVALPPAGGAQTL